jgi:hypothetical protein
VTLGFARRLFITWYFLGRLSTPIYNYIERGRLSGGSPLVLATWIEVLKHLLTNSWSCRLMHADEIYTGKRQWPPLERTTCHPHHISPYELCCCNQKSNLEWHFLFVYQTITFSRTEYRIHIFAYSLFVFNWKSWKIEKYRLIFRL